VRCSRLQFVKVGCNTLQNGPLTEEGSAALDELRVMLSRAARRRQAYATADAGRLARQNWHVYRA
jgi:hypothetical protein